MGWVGVAAAWVWAAWVWACVSAVPVPGSYFTDEAAARLLHYDLHSGDCVLFGDRRIVDEIMRELAASESPVAVVEAAELTALISACYDRSRHDKRQPAPRAENFPHIIYPGTKWCGTGNVAEGVDDLGSFKEVDACCRDHDLCPEDLEPGETRHNITNESPFVLSHCDCNEAFRKCLKTVGTEEAKEVGYAYFSTGLFQCYKLAKPVKGCKEWTGLLTQACQEYEFDETGNLTWQMLDMKTFE
ncbi:phospholipase A2-like [Eriocheir sinensis]|uniref:phospholipase A2-like n=1 Tax=Eriocheir sinensis TaxID=95602 RepID=UPI0021C7BC9B|nr:phospholipase A2-like [Eriocheir sinensis]XP_050688430.1 phospholipase A2-like [Eriocheir sinensis]XP_050688431.1 phospholipase A2-like [Eriocheir sinensis]